MFIFTLFVARARRATAGLHQNLYVLLPFTPYKYAITYSYTSIADLSKLFTPSLILFFNPALL